MLTVMGSRARYAVVGILALAILAAVSLSHAFVWIWAQLGWDDISVFTRELTISRALAYVAALGAAVFVIKYRPAFQAANEVVDEISKVTWPTREETGNATVVVIAAVFICSAYLGFLDMIWLVLSNWVLGVGHS